MNGCSAALGDLVYNLFSYKQNNINNFSIIVHEKIAMSDIKIQIQKIYYTRITAINSILWKLFFLENNSTRAIR